MSNLSMQKKVNTVFGEETVRLVKKIDAGEEQHTFWNDGGNESAKSKLRIEVISQEKRLKEVKVSEVINEKVWTTRFDPSYRMHGWEVAFKSEIYKKLAERHRQNLPEFVRSITQLQNLSESPKEVFFPHFLREGRNAETESLKKPAPRVFTQMVKIQETYPDNFSINFPKEVVDTMGLKGGKQAAWTAEGKSAVFTPLEGVHYRAMVLKLGTSFGVTIPTELMISMKLKQDMQCEWTVEGNSLLLTPLESFHRTVKLGFVNGLDVTVPKELVRLKKLTKGMVMQWSVEGESKLSLKPTESASPNTVKLRYSNINNEYSVGIPTKIVNSAGLVRGMCCTWTGETDKLILEVHGGKAELGAEDMSFIDQTKIIQAGGSSHIIVIPNSMSKSLHLKPGMRGEWFADGEKMSLKMAEDYPGISKIMQRVRDYGEQLSSAIPKNIAQKVGFKAGNVTTFRINEDGKLLITPVGEGRSMRMYSFGNEDFYDLASTRAADEGKFLEEVGEEIKSKGEVRKDDIQEVFNKHFKNLNPSLARGKLDRILRVFTEYGALTMRESYIEEKPGAKA
ncbi:hypothetical protein H0N98_04530 [Candidatus Micrarchaeota archaeon]|nr:hypothetical protein [Candidatus Micrarchaeota archaeon]